MKTLSVGLLCFALLGLTRGRADVLSGANLPTVPAPTAYAITSRDADHQVWERTSYETTPDGKTVPRLHHYTELATGLNYKNAAGRWTPAKEEIEAFAGGAIARQGQYQVIFANNLNSAGAIDMQTRDGKRLRSNILGLGYYDSSTGKAVLIAQLQDSVGQLIAANQVLYPNAFQGVNADVRYTYKKGSFEQDVILREQPPAPEAYGLDSATTTLEVMTEFLNPPTAKIKRQIGRKSNHADESVRLGGMLIGHGRAFDLGAPDKFRSRASVSKQYVTIDGRNVLIEMVPLTDIQTDLKKLPLPASTKAKLPFTVTHARMFPQTPLARTSGKPMELAAVAPSDKGYVLDYVELSMTDSDLTLQRNTTYYISSSVGVSGTVTIEGGTVVKYGTAIDLECWGGVICDTAPYRPAVFTSATDNTVGESIDTSDDPDYTFEALYINDDATPLSNLRIMHARVGLHDHSLNLHDSQFIDCAHGIMDEWWGDGGYTCYLTNVLMSQVQIPLLGNNSTWYGCHVTITGCQQLADDWNGGSATEAMTFVNSLLVGVTDNGAAIVTTNYTASPVDNSIFQAAGAGGCYLATNSIYRNAGTTDLAPDTLIDLATKTTYPPIVYSNTTLSATTTFSPQAQRDNDGQPDLGYHYDPLDYAFGGVQAGSNVVFTAGTAVGWFELPGNGGPGYGLAISNYANATFNGTVMAPCIFARYDTVQEGGNGNWTDKGWLAGITSLGTNTSAAATATVNAQFTDFALLVTGPNDVRDYQVDMIFRANDCEFWAGDVKGGNTRLYWTNCLVDGTAVGIQSSASSDSAMVLRNCTLRESSLSTSHGSGATWPTWIQNCTFEGRDLSPMDDPSGGNTNITYCDYNAFITNTDRLPRLGAHDILVTNFNWQNSWFGNFYLPATSPLINAGSTTAGQIGLYHFTTQTNQTVEANSVVDIGYHYVVTDVYGNPLDSNSDEIPDYLEDVNGNGLFDYGDLANWQTFGSGGGSLGFTNGLNIFIYEPKLHSQIP